MALIAVVAFGLLLNVVLGKDSSQTSAVTSESQFDLHQIGDRLTLGLASEDECTLAFTTAPLNALNFTDGDTGTQAMSFSDFPLRGVSQVAVGDLITGGKIGRIWLENYEKKISLSGFGHFKTKFKIQTASSTTILPETESFELSVVVNQTSHKIVYCYLENESVAIKTCQMTGGFFDPQQATKCRFNFTGTSCPYTAATTSAGGGDKTCVTGLTATGDLICSNKMLPPPPPPPPPPSFCYCGCTPQMLSGSQACGTAGDQYCSNLDGTTYICGSYDLSGCVVLSTAPGGCGP